jgi:hypothetical protein
LGSLLTLVLPSLILPLVVDIIVCNNKDLPHGFSLIPGDAFLNAKCWFYIRL